MIVCNRKSSSSTSRWSSRILNSLKRRCQRWPYSVIERDRRRRLLSFDFSCWKSLYFLRPESSSQFLYCISSAPLKWKKKKKELIEGPLPFMLPITTSSKIFESSIWVNSIIYFFRLQKSALFTINIKFSCFVSD